MTAPVKCDQICENRPLPANFSFEKYSSKVFVVTQLIGYSSYFHQIFSIASAGWVGGWGAGTASNYGCDML